MAISYVRRLTCFEDFITNAIMQIRVACKIYFRILCVNETVLKGEELF